MQIHIRHVTVYRYDQPIDYAIQLIRLRPRDHAGQRVSSWRVVEAPDGRLPETDDGYGNVVHMLTLNRQHQEATVVAEGVVTTIDTHGILRDAIERLPPAYYLRTTPATHPGESLVDLANGIPGQLALSRLHRLMQTIRERVRYVVGQTSSTTRAAEALAAGHGVCQDHAHIFITAARLLGHPARYVSGYLWEGREAGGSDASHAWAEAFIPDLGWVGFDAANGVCPTESHVRVAIGLDYADAAPIRGLRRGIANESLAVSVDVQQVQGQQ
jgi:transglutaminase-like putative cysteine protease